MKSNTYVQGFIPLRNIGLGELELIWHRKNRSIWTRAHLAYNDDDARRRKHDCKALC